MRLFVWWNSSLINESHNIVVMHTFSLNDWIKRLSSVTGELYSTPNELKRNWSAVLLGLWQYVFIILHQYCDYKPMVLSLDRESSTFHKSRPVTVKWTQLIRRELIAVWTTNFFPFSSQWHTTCMCWQKSSQQQQQKYSQFSVSSTRPLISVNRAIICIGLNNGFRLFSKKVITLTLPFACGRREALLLLLLPIFYLFWHEHKLKTQDILSFLLKWQM